jgi:phage-related protein
MTAIGDWIKNAWNDVIGFFKGLPGKFSSSASSIGNAIKNGFNDAISFITGLPSKMYNWGRDMINSLVNGIRSMISSVTNAVSNVASKIRSFLHFSEPDVGPLVGFHGWWKDMMGGIADDITGNMAPVLKAAQGIAQGIAGSIKIPAVELNGGAQVKTAMSAANGGFSAAGQNNGISQIDSGLMDKLDGILTAIKEGKIIAMEDGTFVGKTAGKYDKALGMLRTLSELGAL